MKNNKGIKSLGEVIGCGPCTNNERIAILFYMLDKKIEKLEKDGNTKDLKEAKNILIQINKSLLYKVNNIKQTYHK